jgi:hypothetical protein
VLNVLALCLLCFMAMRNPAVGKRQGASVRTGNGVVWVDDFAFWNLDGRQGHALCAGLAGGCIVCLEFLPHAECLAVDWRELCGRLGSRDISELRRQVADPFAAPELPYAGFDFDTVRGLVLTAPDKVAKLLTCLSAWLEMPEITPRELDSIQGVQ